MHGERIVIIGAGPAGCSAAVQCQRLGVRPLLIDRAGAAGGLLSNAYNIDNYPGLEPLPGPEFSERIAAHLSQFEIPVTPGTLTSVKPTERGWLLAGESVDLLAEATILAVGTVARTLTCPVPDPDNGRFFYEVRDLLDKLPAPRRVLIIGGGEAALDYALTLARLGARVTILVRGHSLRAGGRLAKMVASHPAIELLLDTELQRARGNGRGVATSVRGPAGAVAETVDAVLVAIGRRSAAPAILDGMDLPVKEGIITGHPGLFIAGDARSGSLGQVGMAVGDGLAAAQAAVSFLKSGGGYNRHLPTESPNPLIKIVSSSGDDDLAQVFVGELSDGSRIEFVESVQPPVPRDQKWVLIISTLKGCPIQCPICDAGGSFAGKLTAAEMLAQIEFLIRRRYPDGRVPVPKLKIQFARMGDPALNDNVLETLTRLPQAFESPGLLPSISTVAPAGRERFFDQLLEIKRRHYAGGRFQMQFSVHTTDERLRRRLIPARTWSLEEMAAYGDRFFAPGDRKLTLNFAPAQGMPLDPHRLAELFSPERFLIKLTPINPTQAAQRSDLTGLIDPADRSACRRIVADFRAAGFETLLSIGELRENRIGSNCGMYAADNAPCGARHDAASVGD